MIAADPFLGSQREHSIALGSRLAIPVVGTTRDYVVTGGIMSYGTSLLEAYEQAGAYAGRILKGEKPSDLPVTQPTRFELIERKRHGFNVPFGLRLAPKRRQ
jgi:putative tryptophan/tyrosine transport system substrate-binding protein